MINLMINHIITDTSVITDITVISVITNTFTEDNSDSKLRINDFIYSNIN